MSRCIRCGEVIREGEEVTGNIEMTKIAYCHKTCPTLEFPLAQLLTLSMDQMVDWVQENANKYMLVKK